MRFLKTQTLNRRALYDGRVALTTSDDFTLVESRSMVLPSSNSAISGAVAGQMRYNTTSNEVEVYQGSTLQWRSIRYKEPGLITAQNLGAGNAVEIYFGPLNPTFPTVAAHNVTWDDAQRAKNILVVVENVLQLPGTNYSIVNNPTLGFETYTPTLSFAATVGSTTLYFNSAVAATGISGSGATVTITFAAKTQTPFAIGDSIVVTGFGVSGYNGTYTVTGSTASSVSYSNVTTTATTVYGTVTSNSATMYPSANFTGATITGSNIQSSTTIVSYVTDPNTDALVSAVISKATITSTIAVNTVMTITETGTAAAGYYVKFSSPPPLGKIVTALIGFDQ